VRKLTIRRLTPERVGQAFPLIQATVPGVTLDDWYAFAERTVTEGDDPPSGILSVVSERGYIAGLCVFRVDYDLVHGPALSATHFLALDLFDREAVAHALADALENLARKHRCLAVHTHVPDWHRKAVQSNDGMAGLLLGRGHRVESVCLCKRLESSAEHTETDRRAAPDSESDQSGRSAAPNLGFA